LSIPEASLPDALDEDITQSLARDIREIVFGSAALPGPYREALILTEYQGLTQKEMAERLGISLSGVRSRVQRAAEGERPADDLLPFRVQHARAGARLPPALLLLRERDIFHRPMKIRTSGYRRGFSQIHPDSGLPRQVFPRPYKSRFQ